MTHTIDVNHTIVVIKTRILFLAKALSISVLTFEHQGVDFLDGVHLSPEGPKLFQSDFEIHS